jgi:hypothetical protein
MSAVDREPIRTAAELRAVHQPLDVAKAEAVSAIVARVVAKAQDDTELGAAKFSSII